MSAGAFEASQYETDSGSIVPIKVQPETLACTFGATPNAAPTGTIDAAFPSAKVSGSKRSIGINARKVNIKFNTAPTGYKQDALISLVVPDKTVYDAIAKNSACTYLGQAAVVVSKTPEYLV